MYAPGTRRHIKGARKAGATMIEIMEVLKLCVVQGVQACNLSVPILAENWSGLNVKAKGPDGNHSPHHRVGRVRHQAAKITLLIFF